MNPIPRTPFLSATAFALSLLLAGGLHAADIGLKNGDFLTGKQFWHGDGKVVSLPDGNKVLELTSNTRDIDHVFQALTLNSLPEVEVKFRARFLGGKGQMRARLGRPDGGSTLFSFALPPDGVWRDITFKHVRDNLKEELALSLETLPYEGKLQIDDVWAGEPGTHPSARPKEPPAATPMPPKPDAPVRPPVVPTPGKPMPAVAVVPPPAPAPRPSAELDLLLDALPADLRAKLNATELAPDDLAAINAWFAKEKLNKPLQMTFVIDTSELTPNDPNRYRVRAANGLLSGKYPVVPHQQVFAYLLASDATELAQLPVGTTITVTGRLGRCDLKQFPAGVRLNIDLGEIVWAQGTRAPGKPMSGAAATPAAAAAHPSAELDRFLDRLPPAMRAELTAKNLSADAIEEINAWFATEVVNKPLQITLVIQISEVVPANPKNFRIYAAEGLLGGKYPAVLRHQFWAYMPSANANDIAQEPLGATIIVSGRLSFCELKSFPTGARLLMNLSDSVWVKNAGAGK